MQEFSCFTCWPIAYCVAAHAKPKQESLQHYKTFIPLVKINRNKQILGYLFENSLAILSFWFHANDKAKSDNELLVRIAMFAFFISWLIAYCFAAHEEFKA